MDAQQVDFVDFPLSNYPTLVIECTVCTKFDRRGINPISGVQAYITIDVDFDDDFSLTRAVAQCLGVYDLADFEHDSEDKKTESETDLVLSFPFSYEKIELKACVDDKREYCAISLQMLAKLCSGLEIIFDKAILRLQGVKKINPYYKNPDLFKYDLETEEE